MQMTRGYKTELDLNNQQITACKKHAGAARNDQGKPSPFMRRVTD